MPAKNLLRVPEKGVYIHIYNKGIEGKPLFNSTEDYNVFLSYIEEYLTEPKAREHVRKEFTVNGKTYKGTPHLPKNYFGKIELVSYALTQDHFHLVVKQEERGALEGFIRSLCTRYSIYFNRKYNRTGSLFGGPYKSAHIQNENELLYLVTHMHHTHKGHGTTSEAGYLSENKSSWIAQRHIHSLFNDAEKASRLGSQNYKIFAEKNSIATLRSNLSNEVLIEKANQPLERSIPFEDLTSKTPVNFPTKARSSRNSKRVPEYAALTFAFLLLVTLGLRNIEITRLSVVSAENVQLSLENKNDISDARTLLRTFSLQTQNQDVLSASVSGKEVSDVETKLLYSATELREGHESAQIYSVPDKNAPILGTVNKGETIVAMPLNNDWFQVHFSDDTFGYISSNEVQLKAAQIP